MINEPKHPLSDLPYAHRWIPGGAHTYSKGDDQFPANAPSTLSRGKGARVWDAKGNEYIDWGMGLASVLFGHAYPPILDAVAEELRNGCNFIRPSVVEAELAEALCRQIPGAEMVKFAKNGSDATSAAVRLARAYTGKKLVLRCADQPFFSIHDWFIGDTVVNAGVPEEISGLTRRFKFNSLEDFERAVAENRREGIACAILQPADAEEPVEGYLAGLRRICEREGIVLIFDEVVTGFRFHARGAQALYGVTPDLTALGKSLGNGFSISALAGKRELMERGGLYHPHPRVFLMSTTYGGETHHIRAALKVIELLNREDLGVVSHIWDVGRRMRESFNRIAKRKGILPRAEMRGVDCKPYFSFLDVSGKPDSALRTLFLQEMAARGILVQALNPSFSHGEAETSQTEAAFEASLGILAEAIERDDVEKRLLGPPVRPVFRRLN